MVTIMTLLKQASPLLLRNRTQENAFGDHGITMKQENAFGDKGDYKVITMKWDEGITCHVDRLD